MRIRYTASDADSTSTAPDPASTSSATDTTSSTASTTTTTLPTPTKSSSSSSSTPPGLHIAIGIVVALFAALALGLLAWWWRRRVLRRRERAEYLADLPPPMMGESSTSTSNPSATLGASLGRTRSARYRDIAAYFGAESAASAGASNRRRRAAPLPPVPRRKPPPPVAKRRSRPLGTIPEVHPRDVLVEDEEVAGSESGNVSRGNGGAPPSPPPAWADVRLVSAQGAGRSNAGTGNTTAVDDREDPWAMRAS